MIGWIRNATTGSATGSDASGHFMMNHPVQQPLKLFFQIEATCRKNNFSRKVDEALHTKSKMLRANAVNQHCWWSRDDPWAGISSHGDARAKNLTTVYNDDMMMWNNAQASTNSYAFILVGRKINETFGYDSSTFHLFFDLYDSRFLNV